MRFCNRMPEKKSSEPHGLHNGHHEAGAQSTLLSQRGAVTCQLLYPSGFAPNIWHNLMEYELEKEKGEHRVDKMRTIELMNAEANTNHEKLGGDAMRNGKAKGLIPPAQAGSRNVTNRPTLPGAKALYGTS